MYPQSIKPISDYKKDRVSQDSRLRPGIIQKQHHEIKQCIFRVRPTDNARFEIDGLKVDQKITYQEWSGESLSAEKREDYEIYHQLAKEMEHLIQHSQYGKSFVKLNGEKVRKDLNQIIEKLKLTESRMHIYRD